VEKRGLPRNSLGECSLDHLEDSGHILKLSVVIPVFNEAETVNLFIENVGYLFNKQTAVLLDFVFVTLRYGGFNLEIIRHNGKHWLLTRGYTIFQLMRSTLRALVPRH
jgi:hypothetical protein